MGKQEAGVSVGELINRAVVAARQHQLAQALDLIGQALASPQATPDLLAKALYNRGVIYAAVNLPEKALPDFEAALAKPELEESDRGRARIARGVALSKLGHHDQGVAALLSFMSGLSAQLPAFQQAQQSLTQIRHERDANDAVLSRLGGQIKSVVISAAARAQAQFDRALLLGERGDWAGALDDYDHLLAQPELLPSLKAMSYCNRGVLRAAQGRLQEAQKDYQSTLAQVQGGAQAHGNALNNWGSMLVNNGQAAAAIELFSQGLLISNLPQQVSLLLLSNRAAALGHVGRLQERCEDLDALLQRQDLSAYRRDALANQRGLLRLQLGDTAGAESDFLAIVSEPIRHGDQAALAYNNLGVLAGKLNHPEQAVAYFSRALETQGAGGAALSNAYFNRGAALAALGQIPQALADYGLAVAQPQGDLAAIVMALNNRAMLLADLGEDAAAWTDLAALLAQNNVDPVQRTKAYATRARICYKRGQWGEVIDAAQAGLREADSVALCLLDILAKVWLGDVAAARTGIDTLRQRPDALAVLGQFRLDLEQARAQGMAPAHIEGVADLLPELSGTVVA